MSLRSNGGLPSPTRPFPGREIAQVKIHSLEHEVLFVLSTLANAHTLLARGSLQPLYATSTAPIQGEARDSAITSAAKHLLEVASVYGYLETRTRHLVAAPPCADLSRAAIGAQSALALAEATLLAVLKDDPYPIVVAQDRNENDREWMFKAPDIPKVRAHLFARLCLAAAEHAARASSLCQGMDKGSGKLHEAFTRYLEDLRRTSRARACRFFGIDAELGGQTGQALAGCRLACMSLVSCPRRPRRVSASAG